MANDELKEKKEAYLYLKNEKYPKLRAKQREEEGYYFQTFNPFPLENSDKPYITHKVKPPRGRRIVDGPADWLAMDKVIVHIPPKSKPSGEEPLKAQKAANQNEKWVQSLVDYQAMVQPYYLRMAAQQLPLRGESWLKIETDWNYLTEKENYQGVPFRWVVPDSMMVYATLDMDSYSRPNMVFEEKVHTFQHLKDLLAQWNPRHQKQINGVLKQLKDVKDYQDVTLVEWCTKTERGYFAGLGGREGSSWYAVPVDGQDSFPNPDGVVPYIRGFSSLGIWPYDGDLTKLVVGFLRPMGDVIIQDARDRSKIDTITNYWAAPITSWITDGNIELGDADLTIGPGHVYTEIKDRKELKLQPAPPVPTAITQQIQMNESLLEEYDPMLLRGRGSPGETSTGQNQRVGLGLQKWEPLKITLRQMIANAISTTFQIVEQMEIPVKIFEHTIDKKDIDGYYKVEIDIKPGNPEEKTRRLLLVKDMTEFLTDEEEAEMMGIEDSTEHFRQLRLKKMYNLMMQNPNSLLFRMVERQAIKEAGMEDIAAEMDAEIAMQEKASGSGSGLVSQQYDRNPSLEGPVIGGSPTRGNQGVPGQPEVANPPGQEDLEAAMTAMGNL